MGEPAPDRATEMTTLGIIVCAHPARTDMAETLAAQVAADGIVWDQGHGELDTHARSWDTAAGLETSHSLVLEDDAVPLVHDLRGALIDVIDVLPKPGLLLGYTGTDSRKAVQAKTLRLHTRARAQGQTWIPLTNTYWGVAICAPTEWAKHIVHKLTTARTAYDQAVGSWVRSRRHPVYACSPPLLDHADTPSLLWGDVPTQRHAHTHG